MWADKPDSPEAKAKALALRYGLGTDAERADILEAQADALEREADRMEGTCWLGDMSPSAARRMRAREKREHAMLLRLHTKAR